MKRPSKFDGEGKSLGGDLSPSPSAGPPGSSRLVPFPVAAAAKGRDTEGAGVSSASASSFVYGLPLTEKLAVQDHGSASVRRSRLLLGFEGSELGVHVVYADLGTPLPGGIADGNTLCPERVIDADPLVVLALPWRSRSQIVGPIVQSIAIDMVDQGGEARIIDAVVDRVHEAMHHVILFRQHDPLNEVAAGSALLDYVACDLACELSVHQRH